MTLSPVQQQLFNYFSLINVSSFESTLKVLKEISNKFDIDISCTKELLLKEISKINEIIQKYDLEIVFIADEITCEKLCILINITDNVVSQKTKFYDENTSQFFSKIVKDCVLSEEGNLSETYCLNLSSQVKITKSAAQFVLQKLVADKWLVSVNDRISLGMRTIAELEQNIKQHYSENIKACPFCKLMVIQGYVCNHCKTKYHLACLKTYLLSKSNHVCPSCKENMLNVSFFGRPEEDSTLNKGPPKKKKKNSGISD